VVGNAYLLCRIADTIEDDPGLDTAAKTYFQNALLAALRTGRGANALGASLGHALSDRVPLAERQLVIAAPRVLGLTRTFGASELNAIGRCVEIMGRGMAHFDRVRGRHGLTDLGELDRYCYTVAGVVGEMLTDLFCGYSEAIAARRDELDRRALRFGRGLQLTNILKDIWHDLEQGRCWLPRDVFERHGYQLRRLAHGHDPASASAFTAGLESLIAVAHSDLREALDYTLFIPSRETGIRKFLVWAIVLAALTLRKIHAQPLFSDGSQVKVSRRSVAATMVASRAVIRSKVGLTALFRVAARGLPMPKGDEELRRSAVRPALLNG
jgi:farnesyl-diphosphate farnesyltransferase